LAHNRIPAGEGQDSRLWILSSMISEFRKYGRLSEDNFQILRTKFEFGG
jgi:hypothetical protein